MALTGRSAIKRALQIIGRLGRGMAVNPDDEADGLMLVNAMLNTWAAQGLKLPANVRTPITWAGGAHSRTIGPTGQIAGTRPLTELDYAALVDGSIEYELVVLNAQQWREEPDRTTEGVLARIRYEPTVPNGTLYGFPVPSAATTVALYYREPAMRAFADQTTSYDLTEGVEEAIVYNLARRWAPIKGRALDADSKQLAIEAIDALMTRVTAENIPLMELDDTIAQFGLPELFNINTGEPM